jgi:hypothetical protein
VIPARLRGITYQAQCGRCRWRSGFYRDGNLAEVFGERHLDRHGPWGSAGLWECRDGEPVRRLGSI